ncbi:hypothetical protein [Thiohalomonas denitrificans]|uniref:Uncharacterized protein n=1 Tax=Thiohalomonas denitrificans TaxID=415747 RepID=A0A1G5QA62_9GAMM|nr:hypothetical protein [Thiohalomonas denitrificans]SCZ58390.1 hypothetical protein SAMN03097708_01683 [Thiohalomonas denitrificans]
MRFVLAFTLLVTAGVAAQPDQRVNPETGLAGWEWQDDAASITFNQRLPDQSRAYFQGRGFRSEEAEQIAQNCVFQAVIRNRADASAAMQLDLADWRVVPVGSEPRPLRLESDWQAEWEQRSVGQGARIAFRWSLFPTVQTFQPGDWNMGMITIGLPPGEPFDLEVNWRQGEESRRLRFENMRCAPDREI